VPGYTGAREEAQKSCHEHQCPLESLKAPSPPRGVSKRISAGVSKRISSRRMGAREIKLYRYAQ
jgi:hypothetical protein